MLQSRVHRLPDAAFIMSRESNLGNIQRLSDRNNYQVGAKGWSKHSKFHILRRDALFTPEGTCRWTTSQQCRSYAVSAR